MASSSSNVVGVHYRVGKKIGEGSFGVIFEGTNLLNNQQVAIKFVQIPLHSKLGNTIVNVRLGIGTPKERCSPTARRVSYIQDSCWLSYVTAPRCIVHSRAAQMLIPSAAGIPNVYYFGQEGLHNILVIDLLGPSLEDLFDHCNRRFTIKTVVMVAKQMVCPSLHLSLNSVVS